MCGCVRVCVSYPKISVKISHQHTRISHALRYPNISVHNQKVAPLHPLLHSQPCTPLVHSLPCTHDCDNPWPYTPRHVHTHTCLGSYACRHAHIHVYLGSYTCRHARTHACVSHMRVKWCCLSSSFSAALFLSSPSQTRFEWLLSSPFISSHSLSQALQPPLLSFTASSPLFYCLLLSL